MICQLLALKQWIIKQPRFSFCDNWNNQGQGIMYSKPLHLIIRYQVSHAIAVKSVVEQTEYSHEWL